MRQERVNHCRDRRSESGSVLVMTVIAMFAFTLVLGTAIDVSRMYMMRAELQTAADAAALAAARELDGDLSGVNNAANRAIAIANSYQKLGQAGRAITVAKNTGVEFAVNLNTADGNGRTYVNWGTFNGWTTAQKAAFADKVRFVRVTTNSGSIGMIFSTGVLGSAHTEARTATAGLSPGINTPCDLVPLSAYNNTGAPFVPGNTYTIRLDPGNAVSPGNYLILSFPGCQGGNCTRDGLAGMNNQCATLGSTLTIDTQPGVQTGPVSQGINSRFDQYQGGGLDHTEAPPDLNVKEGITLAQYRDGLNPATRIPNGQQDNYDAPNPSHTGVADRRIIVMPIFNNPPGNGSSSITVSSFGVFFLQNSVPNGNGGGGGVITAEYITDNLNIAQGYYNCNGGSTQLTIPVLYK